MSNKLREQIISTNKNNEYDCLLMFSGGKDSSYLLYYLVEELNLRVVTITITHDFLPKETIQNIESFSARFSSKHINIENKKLNQAGKHFLNTWIKDPQAGSLINLCTGCRFGLIKLIVDCAKKEGLNVVINGMTPYEATDKRTSLVNYKGKKGRFYFLFGYLYLIYRNPSLVKSFTAFKTMLMEFYYFLKKDKIYNHIKLNELKPFYDYITYDESKIVATLDKLNWKKSSSTSKNSYWRSDCDMYAIRHYFYNQVANYNEAKHYYSKMYEDNLINEEYMNKYSSSHVAKEEIINLLQKQKLSDVAMLKYNEFVQRFANSDTPFPDCGSCKGLAK